jgi:hypothetical protein
MANSIPAQRLCLRQLELEEANALLAGRPHSEHPWARGYPTDGTLTAVDGFVRAVAAGDPSSILSGPQASLDAHLAVFAAERARRDGVVATVPSS